MNPSNGTGRSPNPILEAITVRRRRLVLAVLRDRRSPVSERELATHIAAMEGEKPLVDVTREEVSSIHVDLTHAQLPKLETASLVIRDAEEATVTTSDHPALNDPAFLEIVETDAEGWDAVVATLGHQRRRTILAILQEQTDPMARADLAREVLRREAEEAETEPPTDVPSDVLTSLHHVHLPKLAEAGLVAYDLDAGTTTYEGHSQLDEEWLTFEPDETPRVPVGVARVSSDIWTTKGRESAERGWSLLD